MTTIAGARDRLPGHDEDDVLALIEETGGLTWAWNIGLGEAREVRILTKCVNYFAAHGKPLNWDWPQVKDEILRGWSKPFIPGTRLQIILNCSSTHIINLIEGREMKVMPGTSWNTGPAGSPLIQTASFWEFLQRRAML